MSYTYALDPTNKFVLATFKGVVTDNDLYEYCHALGVDFPKGVSELVDLSAIEDFHVSSEGIRRLAELDAEFTQRTIELPVAFFVSSELIFGMARMYQMLSEPYSDSKKVFRDFTEAKAWLIENIPA